MSPPPPLAALPIDEVLPALVDALRRSNCAVLRAPTGAGKTTRVPPALLDAGLAGERQLVMLEPRRVAARAAARRMAFERGSEVGAEIGFQVRFERVAGPRTRILVVTEGLLVRLLQDDPFLERFGAVVFDEFHERNLDTDLSLALVRKVQREARPELKLLVMSATIATQKVAEWLGDASVIESEGRLHPVDIRYLDRDDDRPPPLVVASGVERALEQTRGDVLAFLPGVGEIRRAREALESTAVRRSIDLFELYGDLPAGEQDAVLRRGARRKIVLATNVAETSITIDGVTGVVDSGWARVARFDAGVGLDRLELERISRASADQRAGRAGRTEPGIALRMWTAATQRSLDEETEPEIRRVDLAGPMLQLLAFGERDLRAFPWFERPSDAALDQAVELLTLLGAIDARGLTSIGKQLVRVPAHPRIARLLHEGVQRGCAGSAAVAAALLSERDPFRRVPRRRDFQSSAGRNRHHSDSDLLDRVVALESFEHSGSRASLVGELDGGGAQRVLRVADELFRTGERTFGAATAQPDDREEAFLRSVLAAWPDRVARRRAEGDRRAVMLGGRGVRLADESAVMDAELFVCCEIDGGRRGERAEGVVRIASAIERAWLPAERITTSNEVIFDKEKERVVAVRRTRYADLVLDESPTGQIDDEAAARALASSIGDDLGRIVPLADEKLANFLARVRCVANWLPESGFPRMDEPWLRAQLPELLRGCRSFDDARKRDWVELLKGRLDWKQTQLLEREAPERLQVPSGSWIRLEYAEGRSPALAVRIQEVFGLADTPRIAGGRVKVTLHLLAPNYRPQQVTEDLASFWNGAYQEIRKELRARYPKHSWPEDPWNAPAVKKGRSER